MTGGAMDDGYIPLYRSLLNNWLWGEERVFSRAEAWIDILLLVNFTEGTHKIGDEVVPVHPGSRYVTIRELCQRWKWSNTKVTKFMRILEAEKMIVQNKDKKKTLLTVVNWDKYQVQDDKKTSEKRQKKPPKRPPEFAETDLEMTISKYLYKRIKQVNPGFMKPNFQGWCKDIDAILRIDQRDSAELREVIDWTYDNDFWKGVVLSPAKLRKQYDKLNTKRITEEASGGSLFHDPPH